MSAASSRRRTISPRLFSVRAASLYLRSGGRIAFVLPFAALTRGQFEKFRKVHSPARG